MGKEAPDDAASRELILRDYLATARTVLANERTFLAYVRTALTFVVTGAAFLKFSDSAISSLVGWSFLPIGAVIFVIGVYRHERMKHLIKKLEGEKRP